jgi:hypothetical protein
LIWPRYHFHVSFIWPAEGVVASSPTSQKGQSHLVNARLTQLSSGCREPLEQGKEKNPKSHHFPVQRRPESSSAAASLPSSDGSFIPSSAVAPLFGQLVLLSFIGFEINQLDLLVFPTPGPQLPSVRTSTATAVDDGDGCATPTLTAKR